MILNSVEEIKTRNQDHASNFTAELVAIQAALYTRTISKVMHRLPVPRIR